jgi:hypothetical protein
MGSRKMQIEVAQLKVTMTGLRPLQGIRGLRHEC